MLPVSAGPTFYGIPTLPSRSCISIPPMATEQRPASLVTGPEYTLSFVLFCFCRPHSPCLSFSVLLLVRLNKWVWPTKTDLGQRQYLQSPRVDKQVSNLLFILVCNTGDGNEA